jgi:N-methylhydantoinase A
VLGRLNPEYFLGGEMSLDIDAARRAIRHHVAERLGMSVEDAAAGIVRIINATMVKGIADNSVERGHDAREFALVAFGGAGALHAADLAEEMRIRTVIVPTLAGNLSALGLLVSDARHDIVRTLGCLANETHPADLASRFAEPEAEALARLERDGFPPDRIDVLRTVDARYEGQSYEINVPVTRDLDLGALVRDFHGLHQRLYAYSSPHETVQLVNLRVIGIGRVPPVRLRRLGGVSDVDRTAATVQPKARRPVFFFGQGFAETPVYERDHLPVGAEIAGPCLVEEAIAGSVIPARWGARADQYGNLILTRQ